MEVSMGTILAFFAGIVGGIILASLIAAKTKPRMATQNDIPNLPKGDSE